MLTIRISDGLCSIKPWISELKKPLSFKKSVYKLPGDYRAEVKEAVQKGRNPNSVKRYSYETEELFSVDKNVGYFLPGALNIVREKLKELGLGWTEDDQRDPELYPEPVWQNCSELRNEDQLTILASIVSAQGGIVKGCTGVGKSFIIRQLCKMFPTLNILVVTRRASVVKQLAADIAKELPDEVSQVGAGGRGGGTRVIVSTTKSLHKISPDAVQLLLFDEAHAVGDNDVYRELVKITHCRRFGFTATPCRSDGTKLIMQSYFGPELVDIPYERAAEQGLVTKIKYHLLDTPGPAFIDDNVDSGKVTSDLFKKRWGYWRNLQRNLLIGDAVKAAVEKGLQVLVLVESLEHAVLLESQVLPGIPVVHYGRTSEQGFGVLANALLDSKPITGMVLRWAQEQGRIYDKNTAEELTRQWLYSRYRLDNKTKESWCAQFKKGDIRAMVATMTLSEGVDFPELAVVVRGDALASRVYNEQIPGRLSRLFQGKKYGILVDFTDKFSRFSARKALARTTIYEDQNWEQSNNLEELMNGVFA